LSRLIRFNGAEYANVEALPPEVRAALDKHRQSAAPAERADAPAAPAAHV
jgi:hypothetical protein